MPYRVTVHFSEHLPALLIRLYKTQNYDELQMLEDLSQRSQKQILESVRHSLAQNKDFVIIKLSSKILPKVYKQQFEIYQFRQFFERELYDIVELRQTKLTIELFPEELVVIISVCPHEIKFI